MNYHFKRAKANWLPPWMRNLTQGREMIDTNTRMALGIKGKEKRKQTSDRPHSYTNGMTAVSQVLFRKTKMASVSGPPPFRSGTQAYSLRGS